jgi:hypothetical protein
MREKKPTVMAENDEMVLHGIINVGKYELQNRP